MQYSFETEDLAFEALTHSSAAKEIKRRDKISIPWNERLEFLGDSILGLIISTALIEHPKNFSEGELSKIRASLVSEKNLARIARKIELGDLLMFSVGEKKARGDAKTSVLADALEAIFGAVYLDGGYETARAKILDLFADDLSKPLTRLIKNDFKSRLQEITQRRFKETPTYELIASDGPDHDREFKVAVAFREKTLALGRGTNKKKASQNAAAKALEELAANPKLFTDDSGKSLNGSDLPELSS